MSTPSAFECAIRALKQERSDLPERILAIDMDACAAALCIRSAGGAYAIKNGVKLDSAVNSPVTLYETAMTGLAGGSSFDEKALARAWRRYIQSEKTDAPAFGSVTCAQLEAAFAPAAQLYEQLFAQADSLLSGDEEAGILLFGRMAGRSLAAYAARSHFSADPFLPDPMFITSARPESLAEEGRALMQADVEQADRMFMRNVALTLLDSGGADAQSVLAGPAVRLSQLKTPRYGDSFFCCAGDSLALTVDKRQMRVEIPGEVFENGAEHAMLSAGFALDKEGAALYLRSAGGREVRVPLNMN